jgi:hypothetical protein
VKTRERRKEERRVHIAERGERRKRKENGMRYEKKRERMCRIRVTLDP